MTDNEKNKLMAEWAGWESNTNEVGTFWNAPNSQGLFRDTLPNLLYDNGAAVGLLDVLKKRLIIFTIQSTKRGYAIELSPDVGSIFDFKCFWVIEPSISEAICGAILALIEKEEKE